MAEHTISRKGVSEASYAVHRSSEAGPSSPENHDGEDTRSHSPPPYSGPTSSAMSTPQLPQSQANYPGLPRLDYSLYSPQSFDLSSDKTTIISHGPRLSTYPKSLVSLIKSLATVPPKPTIRIRGKNASNPHIDFDVQINLMNLIVSDVEKEKMNYVKIIGPREMGHRGEGRETTLPTVAGGLEEWARMFCADTSAIKEFTLDRVITNWDTSYLEGRLLALVNSTSYLGHTTVSFELTHCRVIIRNPDKVNRFFSNITKVFTGTKKYEVIKSVWPYADVARGEQGRKVAVQEEEVWFANWKDSIRHAIMAKRHGWVTVEDRLEFMMERKADGSGVKPAPWGSGMT